MGQIGEGNEVTVKEQVVSVSNPPEREVTKQLTQYTLSELSKHNKGNDCWVVVDGNVYDVTEFLSEHPGGKRVIMTHAGKDCTDQFHAMHAPSILPKHGPNMQIGVLAPSAKL